MGNALSQSFWIANPTLTEHNLPDQKGRVHVVTGGYAGVGYQLTKILYSRNATVFIAGRSEEKAAKAIAALKEEVPSTTGGKLEFLKLDLADLTTIKASAEDLMSRTSRLDVLTNNAGVMMAPYGSKTVQGYELHVGTNILGPFLFTQLLLPLLKKTAASSPPGSVRVTWAASLATQFVPYTGGVNFKEDGELETTWNVDIAYLASKAANALLSIDFARRYGADKGDIVSAAWNPGNLKSELQRHLNFAKYYTITSICYDAKYGAYTELYAAASPDLTLDNNGSYVVPWGKIGSLRADYEGASKPVSEGGTGKAQKLWEWCEKETKQYA